MFVLGVIVGCIATVIIEIVGFCYLFIKDQRIMKYNPIGTTFMEGDVLLLVQESFGNTSTCSGCFYMSKDNKGRNIYHGSCFTHGHVCTPYYRKDKKHVVFRKINFSPE